MLYTLSEKLHNPDCHTMQVRAGLNAHVLARTKNSVSALKPSLKIVTVLDFSGLKWHF